MTTIREHYEAVLRVSPDSKLVPFMLAHGRDYVIGPDTFAGPRGELHNCYGNATHLAQANPALTYVEGMVLVFGIPIDHAWCVTEDGVVIDPTMMAAHHDGTFNRISGYFGVPMLIDYVIKACLKNGVYGLLDYTTARKTLPQLVELGLEAGQRALLDGKRKAVRRGR